MNEIITFVSFSPGVDENGIQTDTNRTEHFWVWAEVPRMTVKEFSDQQTKVGFTKETPTFYIRALTDKDIEPGWQIEWHGRIYDIKAIDQDYQNRDMLKLKAELYVD